MPNRVRLITASWSDNPRKAAWLLQQLEDRIDFEQRAIEYTFIGRLPGKYKQIKVSPAVSPPFLKNHYDEADIYVAPSQNDPCSNAVIEAQACGLPVLYLDDGGHREIVGVGGEAFHDQTLYSFLWGLKSICENYNRLTQFIEVKSIEKAADEYEEVFHVAIANLKRSKRQD